MYELHSTLREDETKIDPSKIHPLKTKKLGKVEKPIALTSHAWTLSDQKQVEKSVFSQPRVETTHHVLSLKYLSDKYYFCVIKKK